MTVKEWLEENNLTWDDLEVCITEINGKKLDNPIYPTHLDYPIPPDED